MADTEQGVGKPQDWDKAVSVAYLRLRNDSQKDAAKAAGIGQRTVRRWENSEWWPKACFEASSRWLHGLLYVSQQTLYAAISGKSTKGDANLALKVAERRIPELAPPKIAHELFGKGGGAIEITTVEHSITKAENGDDDSE